MPFFVSPQLFCERGEKGITIHYLTFLYSNISVHRNIYRHDVRYNKRQLLIVFIFSPSLPCQLLTSRVGRNTIQMKFIGKVIKWTIYIFSCSWGNRVIIYCFFSPFTSVELLSGNPITCTNICTVYFLLPNFTVPLIFSTKCRLLRLMLVKNARIWIINRYLWYHTFSQLFGRILKPDTINLRNIVYVIIENSLLKLSNSDYFLNFF